MKQYVTLGGYILVYEDTLPKYTIVGFDPGFGERRETAFRSETSVLASAEEDADSREAGEWSEGEE